MRNVVYNMDCMQGMKEYPDKYFDLAIVDPVYGDVTRGGYMKNQGRSTTTEARNEYHIALWDQKKTGKDYFNELFRISKNQIIWGGNYFTEEIQRDSQCWICWDKYRAPGVAFADGELAWTSFNRSLKIFRYKWDGFLQADMKNKEKRIHPTQKPVALYEWLLNNFAVEGDLILDTHVGSGSSRIACYNLNFDFVGYEIDETYFKDQEKRYEAHTRQLRLF